MIFMAATFYSFGKAFLWPTMLGVAGERYPQSGSVAMGALGAAGMLTVGQIAGARIGAQQGFSTSEVLQSVSAETFERYASPEPTSSWYYDYTPIDPAKLAAAQSIELEDGKIAEPADGGDALAPISSAALISEDAKPDLLANAATDVPMVQTAYLRGSQKALTLTSYIPAAMAVGFLILLIYYKAIGGYKVLKVDDEGKVVEADAAH
jgi:hypothetical protein